LNGIELVGAIKDRLDG